MGNNRQNWHSLTNSLNRYLSHPTFPRFLGVFSPDFSLGLPGFLKFSEALSNGSLSHGLRERNGGVNVRKDRLAEGRKQKCRLDYTLQRRRRGRMNTKYWVAGSWEGMLGWICDIRTRRALKHSVFHLAITWISLANFYALWGFRGPRQLWGV